MSEINPKKVAFVFPGQGSQSVGMAKEICDAERNAKYAFEVVAKECDFDLFKTSWVGPEEALKRTCHTQPALLAASAACLQAFRNHFTENPICVAGHSLGEITALWAAEALTLTEAAQLTVLRGQLMENAPKGSMAAVIGMEGDVLAKICEEEGVVVANYNSPHQQVISGDTEKIEHISNRIKEQKVKVIKLPVGGAFHSPLMDEANRQFASRLEQVNFKNAICPVIQNVDAEAYTEGSTLKTNLQKQMTSSVQWVKTIHTALNLGAECFVEIGSGKVLSGLIRKIDANIKVLHVGDSESLKHTLDELKVSVSV
jgi:[acyl-carrier-protein] S-malonyltransferase